MWSVEYGPNHAEGGRNIVIYSYWEENHLNIILLTWDKKISKCHKTAVNAENQIHRESEFLWIFTKVPKKVSIQYTVP